jgi:hypothetical protein
MVTTSAAVAPNGEAYNGVAPTGTSGMADPAIVASDGTLPATTAPATTGRRHRKGLFSRATNDMVIVCLFSARENVVMTQTTTTHYKILP